MKHQNKIAITATSIAVTSLMITAYLAEPVSSAVSPQIAPVSEVVAESRACTPPIDIEPIVAEEIIEISTQTEKIPEPTHQEEVIGHEISPPQPTEKEISDTTSIPNTQTATKPTTPPTESTHKNGATRIVDGKQQGYLLGFGWVDYMGENECIFEEGMYENGNKVGIMGGTTAGSDGDINKQVGIMD